MPAHRRNVLPTLGWTAHLRAAPLRTMRIGIDVRQLQRGPSTGGAQVSCRLIEALAREDRGAALVLFANGREASPRIFTAWQEAFANVRVSTHRIPNRLFDLCARFIRVPKIDRMLGGVDVFFSPHTLITPLLHAPRVLVVHDLSFLAHPEFFSPVSRRWHALMDMRAQAREAAQIIVPSQATARDLKRFWRILDAKITVIPWGAPSNAERSTFNVERGRYVLFVGTIERRKNIIGLVRAFEIMKRDRAFNDVRLVLAGALGWGSGAVQSAIASSPVRDAIFLRGYVSQEEKAALMAQAALFVYPSFYEGFGLPVGEAMASGVPVVASQSTAIPEVSGSAALLVNPREPQEIAMAMCAVLTDHNLSAELSRRGPIRAAKFSWENTAKRVLAVLRKASGKTTNTHRTNRRISRSAENSQETAFVRSEYSYS